MGKKAKPRSVDGIRNFIRIVKQVRDGFEQNTQYRPAIRLYVLVHCEALIRLLEASITLTAASK